MKAVLISIKPKWCELIFEGKKTIEVRKTRPKLETPFKVYIYCTKKKDFVLDGEPDWGGKVIGEFVCDKITDMRDMGGEEFFSTSCMTYEDWRNYTDYTKHIIWGWHISDLKIYDEPKELSEFRVHDKTYDKSFAWAFSETTAPLKRPPQSWSYVEEME